MNNRQLKCFTNVTRIMKSELAYSNWMTMCIYATYAAWLLIIATCLLEAAITPKPLSLLAFDLAMLAGFILLIYCCKEYKSMYRSSMSVLNASEIDYDLAENAVFLETNFPVAVTKENVYINFRCNLTKIERSSIASAAVVSNYTKRHVHESLSVQIATKDNRIFVIPILTRNRAYLIDEAVKAINS